MVLSHQIYYFDRVFIVESELYLIGSIVELESHVNKILFGSSGRNLLTMAVAFA